MGEQQVSIEHFNYYVMHHKKYQGGNICFYFSPEYDAMTQKILNSDCFKKLSEKILLCNFEECNKQDQVDFFRRCDVAVMFYNKFHTESDFEFYAEHIQPFYGSLDEEVLRVIPIVDAGDHFDQIYKISPSRIAALNKSLIDLSNQSKTMKVQSGLGTDLIINLDSADPWTNIDGINLFDSMPSEIATYTSDVNGRFVFQGSILSLIPIAAKYGVLEESVVFEIEEGCIVSCSGDNEELLSDLNEYFNYQSSHRKIEEIGIGTNEGLPTLLGTSGPFEERHAGFHLGLGGKEKGSIHLDLLSADSQIYFDDTLVFNKQFYL